MAVWTPPRGRSWEQRAVLLQALPDYQPAWTLPMSRSLPLWRTPLPIVETGRESLEMTTREGSVEGPGPLTVAELIRQAEEALRGLRERQVVFLQERHEHSEDNSGTGDEGVDPLGGTKSKKLD